MRARAAWHFGGGPAYCAACRHEQTPCATAAPSCPYRRYAPASVDGWIAWETACVGARQLRVGPDGRVIGLDLGALLALGVARGGDAAGLAELLPAIEDGLADALAAAEA